MRLIRTNILHFIKSQPILFILFQICVIASSLLFFFAFGAYQNYRVLQQGVEESQLECTVYFYDTDADGMKQYFQAAQAQLYDCICALPDAICDNLNLAAVLYHYQFPDQYSELYSRFSYRDSVFTPMTRAFRIAAGTAISKRDFRIFPFPITIRAKKSPRQTAPLSMGTSNSGSAAFRFTPTVFCVCRRWRFRFPPYRLISGRKWSISALTGRPVPGNTRN